jgi:hypothetical protein
LINSDSVLTFSTSSLTTLSLSKKSGFTKWTLSKWEEPIRTFLHQP